VALCRAFHVLQRQLEKTGWPGRAGHDGTARAKRDDATHRHADRADRDSDVVLLAVLTVATGRIPAFHWRPMTFAIGALVGPVTWIGGRICGRLRSAAGGSSGVGGLFGYTRCISCAALRAPAESLLNYLWPF